MDLQEAYKVLGVSEEATADEIEKQYMTWIRRNRSYEHLKDEKPFDFDLITTAYNIIKSYKSDANSDRSFKDKTKHFLYYYKFHIVGVIILLIFCGSMIQTAIENQQEKKELASLPPEDLSILLFGDYFNLNSETTPVVDNTLALFPSWERVTVNLNYSPDEVNDSMDAGNQQKSVVTLMYDESDLFIMEKAHAKQFMSMGLFLPLEELDPSLEEKLSSTKLIHAKTEEDETEHVYGVILSDTAIFNGFQTQGGEKVMAVKADAKNKENALKLIEELAN